MSITFVLYTTLNFLVFYWWRKIILTRTFSVAYAPTTVEKSPKLAAQTLRTWKSGSRQRAAKRSKKISSDISFPIKGAILLSNCQSQSQGRRRKIISLDIFRGIIIWASKQGMAPQLVIGITSSTYMVKCEITWQWTHTFDIEKILHKNDIHIID